MRQLTKTKASFKTVRNSILKSDIRLLQYRNMHMSFIRTGLEDTLEECKNRPEKDTKSRRCLGILEGIKRSTRVNKASIKVLKRQRVK